MLGKFIMALMLCLGSPFAQAQDAPARRVLFLCTGNYFRSVYAESYFNALAERNQRLSPQDPLRKKVRWVAESRGLDVAQLSPAMRASRVSRYTLERLKQRNLPLAVDPATRLPLRLPTQVSLADLETFDRVVALHGPTHRPMLRAIISRGGPGAKDPEAEPGRVVYWDIPDVVNTPAIPLSGPQQADRILDAIEAQVERLFASLGD
jgi:protein-tyrosine phosphatase